eukprot:766829-Hanusia_phi.AAC.1
MQHPARTTDRERNDTCRREEGGAGTDIVQYNMAASTIERYHPAINASLTSEECMLALTIKNKELDQPLYESLREHRGRVRKLQSDLQRSTWTGISDEDFVRRFSEMEGVYEQIELLERQLGSISNSFSNRCIDRSLLDHHADATYRLRQKQIELRLSRRDSPSYSATNFPQPVQAVSTSTSS